MTQPAAAMLGCSLLIGLLCVCIWRCRRRHHGRRSSSPASAAEPSIDVSIPADDESKPIVNIGKQRDDSRRFEYELDDDGEAARRASQLDESGGAGPTKLRGGEPGISADWVSDKLAENQERKMERQPVLWDDGATWVDDDEMPTPLLSSR